MLPRPSFYASRMKVTGLDLSLTSTGWATANELGITGNGTIKTGKLRGHERLAFLIDRTVQAAADSDLVVVEGLSYASFDAGKAIAGHSWIIRHRLWEEELPYWLITPSERMRYATGKGQATKQAVIDAVTDHVRGAWPRNDDEADAAALAAMGCRALSEPIDDFAEDHWTKLMGLVDFPTLR